jgi:hypothetical protein
MKCHLLLGLGVVAALCRPGYADEGSTYDLIQHHVFDSNCTNCHREGTSFARQSGLVLTSDVSYDQLVNRLPTNAAARADGLVRVNSVGGFAGVQQSFLWEKINAPESFHFYADHPNYGAIMPLGGQPLTNGELALVNCWIGQSAPRTGAVCDPALLDDTSRWEPPEFVPLAPPERGIQLHLGPFDAWPAQVHDREFLYFKPHVTTEDEFITRYQVSYRPVSHHFILYNYAQGASTPTPNVYRDLRNQQGQLNLGVAIQLSQLFPFQAFIGSQSPYLDYSLPEGVALRLPAGSGFDMNVHTVNRTDQTQQGEVYVNMHTVDRSEVRYVADFGNFGNTDIYLPPNQVTTISKTFTFAEQQHVIQIWSHSHEHTLQFRIERVGGPRDGELLYWTNDWEHPPILYLDPPLTFEAGEQIRLVTTYNNWTNSPIRFGPLSSDEMQFMFYIYYTGELSSALPGDVTLDGTVDRRDLAQLAQSYGMRSGARWLDGDLNGDGGVGLVDLALVQRNLGQTSAWSPNAVMVPEPPAALLTLAALVALVGGGICRRGRVRCG